MLLSFMFCKIELLSLRAWGLLLAFVDKRTTRGLDNAAPRFIASPAAEAIMCSLRLCRSNKS